MTLVRLGLGSLHLCRQSRLSASLSFALSTSIRESVWFSNGERWRGGGVESQGS